MASKTTFKMPTDKQIWAEVDDQIAIISEAYKKLRGQPDRQDLFDKKKAFYLATPQRLEEEAKAKAAQSKKLADADAAYLAIRRAQGKPIITVKQFLDEFPQIAKEAGLKKATQQALHEAYEVCSFIHSTKALQKKVARMHALSRKFLYAYLAQTYGLYRRIINSDVATTAFSDIAAMLWNDYKIKTHHDIPRASLLLKLIFDDTPDKTIHLYGRSFQLAAGYEVEEDGYTDFIKEMGGMEKIRKAYATVIAADAGKLLPAYEKDAEYSASLNTLRNLKPLKVVQLAGNEGNAFSNDLLGYYCLVVAHIDPLNQLELYGQWPADKQMTAEIIRKISAAEKKAGSPSWIKHKAASAAFSAERLRVKLVAKEEKRQEKEAKAAKKAEVLAKKNAAAEKCFAKQRAAQSRVKTSKPKPAAKTKVVTKTKPATKPKAVAKKK